MTAAFSNDVKMAVYERAQGRCDKCGTPVVNGAHFHHRRARGMGSTKRPESKSAANCLLLHPACHDSIEKHRQDALASGWLITQHDDPRLMPAIIKGVWCVLNEDGTLNPLGRGVARGSAPHD